MLAAAVQWVTSACNHQKSVKNDPKHHKKLGDCLGTCVVLGLGHRGAVGSGGCGRDLPGRYKVSLDFGHLQPLITILVKN